VGSSALYDGEMIYNDETPESVYDTEVEGQGRGLMLDMRGPGDYEYGEFASPFPSSLLIPMSEMEDRIKEMEETKSRVSDLCTQAGLPCQNQASTNYCWFHSPTYIVEVHQVVSNQPILDLSAVSGASRIKNFRNVGGWGREAVEWLVKNGVNTKSEWPENAIDRRYDTPQNRELAKTRLVTEFIELRPRNMHQLLSLLVRRIPVTGGFNWWRHQVSLIDPLWLDGAPAIRQRNSWGMQWGAQGYGILQGSKALPDDAVAIVSNRLFVR
jgi:hypothetical protein